MALFEHGEKIAFTRDDLRGRFKKGDKGTVIVQRPGDLGILVLPDGATQSIAVSYSEIKHSAGTSYASRGPGP